MNKKTVVIAGATGLVGKMLCEELSNRGYELIVITRDSVSAKKLLLKVDRYITWSDNNELEKAINGSYGIINLSGSPIVGKRWTKEYKKILFDSRIKTTNTIVKTIKKVVIKPKVLINGSAVGYYGTVLKDKSYDESAPPGSDFLAKLCQSWEEEARIAEQWGLRVVCIRSGIVLDKKDGALPRLLTPFAYFIGGPIGSGMQYFPWIHIKDEVGIICFALENQDVNGPINAVAPDIITNKSFAKAIGTALHRPSFFPVPLLVLKILFGEAAEVLTKGVKISSGKIISLGYVFQYSKVEKTLQNILHN